MKIALTGGSGGIGLAIIAQALEQGHTVVSLDRVTADAMPEHENLHFVQANIADYDALVENFRGCDGLIHMAAIPTPLDHPNHVVHNNNVVGSYNAIRAAIENGITRICQASSVNAIGLAFSRKPRFDYFPIDENHPCHAEDPYSLSKWICEQQAESFARRYKDLCISSMRFHWVVSHRSKAAQFYSNIDSESGKHLWAYTLTDAAAQACLLSLSAQFKGHEAFYIVAPNTLVDVPSLQLAKQLFSDVPIHGDLRDHRSFFDSSKAERMLGWIHPDA